MITDPEQAPEGIDTKFLPRPSGTAWAEWLTLHKAPMTIWESRPVIVPRLILVHTNGANGQGTWASAYNWSMAAPNNTKPHYQVDYDGVAKKFLPSNRKGIGNGTVGSKTGGVMAADFSLVIETADLGWGAGKPGPTCGFSEAQADTLVRILVDECKLWNIPAQYPGSWDGTGVACHTEPFGYPFWTIDPGHVCPGTQKKIEMAQIIMPRVQHILNNQPPSEEDDMANITHFIAVSGTQGQGIWTEGSAPVLFPSLADRDEILKGLGLWDDTTDEPKPGRTMSIEMFRRLGGVGL